MSSNKEIEDTILKAIQTSFADLGVDLAAFRDLLQTASVKNQGKVVAGWRIDHQSMIANVSEDLSNVAEMQRDRAALKALLHSLELPQLRHRYSSITEAHAKTFDWIFESGSHANVPWSDFSQWLRNDNGEDHLYWMTGKPGSGKSTLMRYIYDDRRTYDILQQWAPSRKLVTASCFFWNPGSSIQKSLEGLLRSITYDILSQCPEFVPLAAAWRWQAHKLGVLNLTPWLNTELLRTFDALMDLMYDKYKVCLLIDGLDEFEGDDLARTQINHLLKEVARRPHVKVCVASRPWLIFEDAFQGKPSLLLQQLTHQDIKRFVETELVDHPKFSRLKSRDNSGCLNLVSAITEKAEGVFLWVFLVVRSLLEGLRNEDGIRDLQRRLDKIPADLEAYFEQIMGTLEPFYLNQAMQLFQLAIYAERSLSLLTYSYIMTDDPEIALTRERQPLPISAIFDRYEPAVRRLNGLCKGLLESHEPIKFN